MITDSVELQLVLALVIGYLCGSVPFGVILTRIAGAGDLRTIGSGNIGATNVLRTGRKGLAAATLIGDLLKGTVAVLIAKTYFGPDAALLAAVAAFLGHLFPVWLNFKGGKGVATFLGVALALSWPSALAFAIVWLAMARLFRYSSLSALVASVISPMIAAYSGDLRISSVLGLLTVTLWWTHRANIARLLAGTEGRIGAK